MQLEPPCPSLTVPKAADLRGSDQRREELSVNVSCTHGCGSIAQCKHHNLTRCNLRNIATLSNLSIEDLQTSLQTVTLENSYLTARVGMLKHQHKFTSQILADPLTPVLVNTAPQCSKQVPAANPQHSKKRSLSTSAAPIKPDSSGSFFGFCAKTPVTSASPNYPDFMALCTKQPVCASSQACLRKKCKQSTGDCQHHCLHLCEKAMPHRVKQAPTSTCHTKGNV